MSNETEEKVMYGSPEAATYRTDLKGWVSRHGRYYAEDKHAAMFDGSTHGFCECGEEALKGYISCRRHHDEANLKTYLAMPEKEWDGKSCVYSKKTDKYYFGIGELMEDICDETGEENPDLSEYRLVHCDPCIAGEIDPNDYYGDDLPEEDRVVPSEIEALFKTLNDALATGGHILSYQTGKYRVTFNK